MPIPQCAEDISAQWLGDALASVIDGHAIAGVSTRVIGAEKGFLSQTVRVAIDYGQPTNGAPRAVVVKIEPAGGSARERERGVKAFEREIRFYNEVAGHLRISVPRVFFSAMEPDGSVLILEDLTGLECVDQLHGLRNEQVVLTVREIAKLHAAYWNQPSLEDLAWAPAHDTYFRAGYEEYWPAFARAYELRIGREAVALGERVMRHLDWLEEHIAAGPATFVHGDLRADNLLFRAQPLGVVILDWQLATRSLGAIDVARLLGGSEPAAERRGHQLEVFGAWHEALLRNGVNNYEFEDGLRDFRLAVLYCLFVPVHAFTVIGPDSGARTGRLIDSGAERFFASAIELDAGALLP